MIIKLRKPIKWNNEEVSELDLQPENLRPDDLIDTEEEIMKDKRIAVVMDSSRDYCIRLAARALKMPVETLKQLEIRDFRIVVDRVLSFLLDTDSTTNEEAETPAINPEISSEELQSD